MADANNVRDRSGRGDRQAVAVAHAEARDASIPKGTSKDQSFRGNAPPVTGINPAARRQRLRGADAEGRGGELKTCWTKPLYDTASYAFSIVDLPSSGVGKTELARALAHALFGTDDALVRLDLSEFTGTSSESDNPGTNGLPATHRQLAGVNNQGEQQ